MTSARKRISRISHHGWKEYQIRNKTAGKSFEKPEKAAQCIVPHLLHGPAVDQHPSRLLPPRPPRQFLATGVSLIYRLYPVIVILANGIYIHTDIRLCITSSEKCYNTEEMYRQTANNRELTFAVFEIYCKFAVNFESRIL